MELYKLGEATGYIRQSGYCQYPLNLSQFCQKTPSS